MSAGQMPVDYAYSALEKKAVREYAPNNIIPDDVRTSVLMRRGSPEFRKKLLNAYDSTCCITGCKEQEVLEAAHIVPHAFGGPMTLENGLLLRADIHTLFDLHIIKVCENGIVSVDETVTDYEYRKWHGKKITIPSSTKKAAIRKAIKARNSEYSKVANKRKIILIEPFDSGYV